MKLETAIMTLAYSIIPLCTFIWIEFLHLLNT
jgi:hypothetical protein